MGWLQKSDFVRASTLFGVQETEIIPTCFANVVVDFIDQLLNNGVLIIMAQRLLFKNKNYHEK